MAALAVAPELAANSVIASEIPGKLLIIVCSAACTTPALAVAETISAVTTVATPSTIVASMTAAPTSSEATAAPSAVNTAVSVTAAPSSTVSSPNKRTSPTIIGFSNIPGELALFWHAAIMPSRRELALAILSCLAASPVFPLKLSLILSLVIAEQLEPKLFINP